MSESFGQEGSVRVSAYEAEARRVRLILLRNLLGVSVVLALLGMIGQQFLVPPDEGKQRRSTWSTSGDGFRGVHEVSARLGYRTQRHEASFGQLPIPAQDHTLVVIDPLSTWLLAAREKTALDAAQMRALREWVEAGGNLVVAMPGRRALQFMGAEVETTEVGRAGEGDLVPRLLDGVAPLTSWMPMRGVVRGEDELAGLELELPEISEDDAFLVANYLRRGGEDARLLRFVDSVRGPLELLTFSELPDGFAPVVRLREEPLVVARPLGLGRMWLMSSSYPMTNMGLSPRGGCGLLVQRLLHTASDGGRRALVFDEYTHGLWERSGLFSLVWASPVRYLVYAFCLLVVVVGWRGNARLGAPTPERTVPRRAEEEFVISLADLAQRAGRYRAAARWLHDARRPDLPPAGVDPVADALSARAVAKGPFGPLELTKYAAALDETAREYAARRTTVLPGAPPPTAHHRSPSEDA